MMDYSPNGMSSQGTVNPMEQFPLEEFSSPLSGQIFELCDPELFSEVNSNSNCCYDGNSNSYAMDLKPFPNNTFENNCKTNTTTTSSTANSSAAPAPNPTNISDKNNNNLSVIFDSPEELENELNASIDFSPFSASQIYNANNNINNSNQQNQYDFSSIPISQNQLQFPYHHDPSNLHIVGPTLPSVFEDECLSFVPLNMRLNSNPPGSNNLYLESAVATYFPENLNSVTSADNSGIFNNGFYMNCNNEIQIQHLDFQGENGGFFCPDSLAKVYTSNELQALSNENQHVANGGGGSNPLASDLSSLDDSTFKIRKLSPEERKEKIHRYMKKRNERNFSKKIKYACRKTLADSRPRVRGRFAKNDELLVCESLRAACANHEDDLDEDSLPTVVVKEEMFDSSDIFAHISGVNSFKCNYDQIHSWL